MIDDRVTVFIPVRHFVAAYLREAVQSIFTQTRADWTLLVLVHPGHGPAVREALGDALDDPRVHPIGTEGHNLAAAYNTAMRATTTGYITALLGDDLFAADTVEVLGNAIRQSPAVDFFHSGRYFIDDAGKRISSDYLPDRPVSRESFLRMSPVKHLLCWRASTGLACGGVDESLENFGSDDYDFPWTMFEHGASFKSIPRALYVVRDHRHGFRLTTHLPRDAQREGLRHILLKHGVPGKVARQRVHEANSDFMRQALFRNRFHRWLLEKLDRDARRGWREPYR